MKAMIVVPAGLALMVGAYLLGRAGREPAPLPAKPHAHRPVGCRHPVPEGEIPPLPPPPARPEVTEQDRVQAAGRLKELHAELRRAVENRPAALNDLQNFLLSALGEGRLTAGQVLDMFRAEGDVAVLDVLQGALAASPEAADQPGVREAFERIARADASVDRRQAAVAFLGGVGDREGGVRKTLLSLAEADGELSLRLTALGALAGYSQRNGEHAAAVNAGLFEIARPGPNGEEIRTQALAAVEARSADERTMRRLSEFLADPSGAVRLTSAERMAEAPPAFRASSVVAIEEALIREPVPDSKPVLLAHLVKAGRAESIAALERLAAAEPRVRADALDYIAILRAGYVDWSDIQFEKSKR